MLDTLHITLIIICIFFIVFSIIMYREKSFTNYQLDRFKTDILEKQSTSYIPPDVRTETYERILLNRRRDYKLEDERYLEEYAEQELVVDFIREIKRLKLIKTKTNPQKWCDATLEIYVNKEHLS